MLEEFLETVYEIEDLDAGMRKLMEELEQMDAAKDGPKEEPAPESAEYFSLRLHSRSNSAAEPSGTIS